MAAPADRGRYVRFGPFEADLRLGELRSDGRKAKLQEQPFQILAILLEQPGEVVTREEFRRRLWPTDTFVDFEHSINTAVKKLREALGDDAEHPRYIETLPRHGYRFIYPVVPASPLGAVAAASSPPMDVGAGLAPAAGPSVSQWSALLEPHWIGFLAIVVVAAAVAVAIRFWPRSSRPTPPEAPLTAVPLTAYPGFEESPTFSPDGTQVAFAWNGEKEDNWDIYVKVIGSEPPQRLTTNPARELSPAWSPDGRWIVFLRDLSAGNCAVVLTSPIPGEQRVVTEQKLDLEHSLVDLPYLGWSSDSRWLAMAAVPEEEVIGSGAATSIFLFSLETGEKRRLTSHPEGGFGDTGPAFSPDGRTLAFCRYAQYANSDLYLLDLSPDRKSLGEPRRITFGNSRASSPVWTTDGRAIVFSSSGKGLWRVAASGGSSPQRLPTASANAATLAISRGGDRLAYAQRTENWDIWRMELPSPQKKASPPQRFISSTRNDLMPDLSPDGKKIAFESDRSGNPAVWTCDADGSNLRRASSLDNGSCGTPHWSPDSSRVTFPCTHGEQRDVYVADVAGGLPRRLTSIAAGAGNPSWSSDGRWILFDVSVSGGIWKVSPEGGPIIQVTNKMEWGPRESPDGKFIYFSKVFDRGATLWRTPMEGGEAQEVLGSLAYWLAYALVEGGIYFVPKAERESGYSLQYLHLATGKVERIASLDKQVLNLAVSPDQRWLLYTQIGSQGSDLMLVENFR